MRADGRATRKGLRLLSVERDEQKGYVHSESGEFNRGYGVCGRLCINVTLATARLHRKDGQFRDVSCSGFGVRKSAHKIDLATPA